MTEQCRIFSRFGDDWVDDGYDCVDEYVYTFTSHIQCLSGDEFDSMHLDQINEQYEYRILHHVATIHGNETWSNINELFADDLSGRVLVFTPSVESDDNPTVYAGTDAEGWSTLVAIALLWSTGDRYWLQVPR